MTDNSAKHAVRRAKQERRVGDDAVCVLCGYAEPEGLRRVPMGQLTKTVRSVIEEHHVVGRANDPTLTVPLCLRCHAESTEQLRRVEASMQPPRTLLDRLIAILRALAAFFMTLGKQFLNWASELAAFVQALDANCPKWRELEAAS